VFITDERYLSSIIIKTYEDLNNPIFSHRKGIVTQVLNELRKEIEKAMIKYNGSSVFKYIKINSKDIYGKNIICDKESNIQNKGSGETGKSIKTTDNINYQIKNFKKLQWYAHTDNFGSDQEKLFIIFMKDHMPELAEIFENIVLLRNERYLKLASVLEGRYYEPDFVLFLSEKDRPTNRYQIFIECKGKHLFNNDSWKEDDLKNINYQDVTGGKNIKIMGMSFYNEENEEDFLNELQEKIGIG